jgi:predicted nucleic acid-binding protein
VTFQVGDRVVLDTNVIASVLPKGTQGEVAGISQDLAKYRICVSFGVFGELMLAPHEIKLLEEGQ